MCPTSLCERLRNISHAYHTQKGSGEVSFDPHGPVLYGPAERAVCILKFGPKKDYNGPFFYLAHLPSSVTSESWVHYFRPRAVCLRVSSWRAFILPYGQKPLRRADVPQPLKTFHQNSQLNFVVMLFSPSGGSRSLRFQISTHGPH
jgi:hypothetical protein